MSTVLPPRRQLPPPRPPRSVHAKPADTQDDDAPPALSLAARIASLQLDQASQLRVRNAGKIFEHPKPTSVHPEATTNTPALVIAGLDPEYLSRLLARPPPPVPLKRTQEPESYLHAPPQLPPRRRSPQKSSSQDHDHTLNMQSDRTSELEQYHQYHNQEEEGIYHHPEPDDPSAHPVEYATEPSGIENSAATGGLFSAGACIKCHDFSVVDTHAAQFPRQYVRSLDELAYNLTEPFTYETEKARAIFTWLHHNIQYDAQSFFAGTVKPATPESTLSSGLAVCEGYAGLFVYLAEKSGLQVYKVSGHGKGFGYRDLAPGEPTPKMSSNHAWNCVLMDGEWRLIDATWGAGALNGSTYEQRFDASWFTANSVEFARRHFPTDPTFQLIPDEDGGPLGWEDYILTPPGPVIFGDFYRLNFLVDLLQPATNVITSGQTVTFTLFKRCEHMTNHDADNYVYVLIIPGSKPLPLEPTAEGGWSSTYQIMNTTEVSLMFISTVNGQDAKGIGIRGFRNALDRKAMSFGGLAKWTVTS